MEKQIIKEYKKFPNPFAEEFTVYDKPRTILNNCLIKMQSDMTIEEYYQVLGMLESARDSLKQIGKEIFGV